MAYPSKLSWSIISTYRGVRVFTNLHWLPPCFLGDYQTGTEGVVKIFALCHPKKCILTYAILYFPCIPLNKNTYISLKNNHLLNFQKRITTLWSHTFVTNRRVLIIIKTWSIMHSIFKFVFSRGAVHDSKFILQTLANYHLSSSGTNSYPYFP
jgi:hypothetical protein